MGKEISKLSKKICMKSSDYKILLLGLEGSGKTTLFDRLKYNEVYVRYPTIGFIADTVIINSLNVVIWDFGGHDKIMKLWYNYFDHTDLVIIVVDASDNEQNEEIKNIFNMLQHYLPGVIIMILLNKCDLPNAITTNDFILNIGLDKFNLKISKIIRTSLVNGAEMKEIKKSICNVLKNINN